MKTLLKILGGILGVLVLVIVAASLYVKFFVDVADVQQRVAKLVEERTGRSLAIQGEARLSVFPWLGAELDGVRLGNAPGFGETPMVETGRLQARVQLLPLLSRRVEMDTLVLEDARVALAVDAEGRNNWADLVKAGEPAPAEPAPGVGLEGLALGGVDIRRAQLSYSDARTGDAFTLSDFNLKTGMLVPGAPVDITLGTDYDTGRRQTAGRLGFAGEVRYDLSGKRYQLAGIKLTHTLTRSPTGTTGDASLSGDIDADLSGEAPKLKLSPFALVASLQELQPGIAADIRLGAEVDADLGANRLRVAGLDGTAKFSGAALPGGSAEGRLTGDVDYDMAAGKLSVSKLVFDGLGARLNADLQASGLTGGSPQASGEVSFEAPDMNTLLTVAGQPELARTVKSLSARSVLTGSGTSIRVEPLTAKAVVENAALGKGPVDLTLDARGGLDVAKDSLTLDSLAVKGLGLDVKGNLAATGLGEQTTRKFSGALEVAPFDLRALMKQLGIEPPPTADPKVLGKLGLSSKLAGTGSALSLTAMTLTLDETTVKGDLGLSDFADPAITFKLDVDAINADRYLPPPPPEAKAAPAAPGTGAAGAAPTPLPLDTLRGLKLAGELKVGKLTVSNLKLGNVALSVKARDGDVRVAPLSANLYGGSYQGNVAIDARGQTAKLQADQTLSGIQAEPLLTDLTGSSKLAGRGDFKLAVTASGNDSAALTRTLDGKGSLALRDGKVKGVNIGRLLRQAKVGFTEKVAEEEATDFAELTGSFTIAKGVVDNRDLQLKSPLFRIEGAGTAALPTEAIDYLVKTTVVATAKGQGGKDLAALSGLTIPIKVTGTFQNPKWAPDFTGIDLKDAAKALLEQGGELGDKAKEALQTDKLEEKLKEKVDPGKLVPGDAGDKVKKLLKF